jgi:MFS transporter, DHA1 family, arabinose polymer utilization protein
MEKRRALLLTVSMAGVVWMSRWMFPVVAPILKQELNLTYAQVGIPPSAAVLFAAIGYGVSGFLTHQIGTRRVLLIAALANIIGALGTILLPSFVSLVVYQSVIGLSEGLFYVAALVLLTNTFATTAVGRALGVLESGVNIGIVLSLMVGTAVATAFGWRYTYILLTMLGFIVILHILATPSGSIREYQHTNFKEMITDPFVITVSISLGLFFFVNWSFWTFAVTYLTDWLHLPYFESGGIVSVSYLIAIFSSYAAGSLTDRAGPKKASLFLLAIGVVSLIVFAISDSITIAIVSILIVASTQGAIIPVLFAFVPKQYSQHEIGRAFGVMLLFAYGVAAIGPFIVGHIADSYGFPTAFLSLVGILAVCGIVIKFRL